MYKSSIENYKAERVSVHQIVLQDNGVPRGYRTHAEAWATCQRGDWMLRIAAFADIPRAMLVRAACACAREALVHVPNQSAISSGPVLHYAIGVHAQQNNPALRAIETAEAWAECETHKNRRTAEDAWQAAARDYFDGAHGYARSAAMSASLTIIQPEEAESAASNASLADACVSGNMGRAASLLKSANIIRAMIPWRVVEDAIGSRAE